MAQTALTDGKKQSDVLAAEWDHRHCREGLDLSALDFTGNTNIPTHLIGWLVKTDGTLTIDSEEGSVGGIILTQNRLKLKADNTIERPTPAKFVQLVRGPAIVKKSGINVTDVAGNTIDIAAVITQLKTLGITVLDDTAETSTQTAH